MTTTDHALQAYIDVAYLASCAVRNIAPDSQRVSNMDLDLIFQEASRQLLAGCCAFALESIAMSTEDFTQAKAIAIRSVVFMDLQRKEVLDSLESAGIWYLPLKGAVIKDYYPSVGMREMSDNDILYDASRTDDMRKIMVGLGFEPEELDIGAHDTFYKDPLFNFEMHHVLFDTDLAERLNPYYSDIPQRLLRNEGTDYGFHFSPEDFYLYTVAHEYKHFLNTGTGLRSCIDTYVYLTNQTLDMNYVIREAEKMGIEDFERANRRLSFHLVEGEAISDDELTMLEYMHCSGVYGNMNIKIKNRIKSYGGGPLGKARYALKRIHIPMENVRIFYPFFYRHRLLLPLLPFVRFGKMVTVSRKAVAREFRALLKE